jgi:hypothetical protein
MRPYPTAEISCGFANASQNHVDPKYSILGHEAYDKIDAKGEKVEQDSRGSIFQLW